MLKILKHSKAIRNSSKVSHPFRDAFEVALHSLLMSDNVSTAGALQEPEPELQTKLFHTGRVAHGATVAGTFFCFLGSMRGMPVPMTLWVKYIFIFVHQPGDFCLKGHFMPSGILVSPKPRPILHPRSSKLTPRLSLDPGRGSMTKLHLPQFPEVGCGQDTLLHIRHLFGAKEC